jgi:ribosomal protein S16
MKINFAEMVCPQCGKVGTYPMIERADEQIDALYEVARRWISNGGWTPDQIKDLMEAQKIAIECKLLLLCESGEENK